MTAIRIERDPAWWAAIAAHPGLAEILGTILPAAIGAVALQPNALPMAAEHGGFIFLRLDALGFVAELHTLFTPEGWGREALEAGIQAINAVWLCGFQSIVTLEVQANRRSRPPVSFGFTRAGDWRDSPIGAVRLWTLSREAWAQSPGIRRHKRSCQ